MKQIQYFTDIYGITEEMLLAFLEVGDNLPSSLSNSRKTKPRRYFNRLLMSSLSLYDLLSLENSANPRIISYLASRYHSHFTLHNYTLEEQCALMLDINLEDLEFLDPTDQKEYDLMIKETKAARDPDDPDCCGNWDYTYVFQLLRYHSAAGLVSNIPYIRSLTKIILQNQGVIPWLESVE